MSKSSATADLHRLIYVSRNRVPGTPPEILAEVESILAASQRNNSRVSITGALIFNVGMFAQVLEGARSDIEATIEKIFRDERHGEIEVLAFEPAQSRGFPSWAMAFVGRSQLGHELFAHIGRVTGFEAKRLEGDRIFDMLRAFAIDEETRAA
jgi:Sensors of blue-light using FAD